MVIIESLNETDVHFVYRNIYKSGVLPVGAKFLGYARSDLTVANIREKCKPFIKVLYNYK